MNEQEINTKFVDAVDYVIKGNAKGAIEETNKLLAEGINPLDIVNEGLVKGMSIVGERFKKGEMFVPEVLIASRAMNMALDIVKPLLDSEDASSLGTIIMGTVKGDLHDIGKKLVIMMLESAGFTVHDIGIDVSKEKFIEAVKENNAKIVGMSAMLTTTMVYMEDVVKALEEAGLRDKVKIIIGGAPTSEKYAEKIGADFYSPDAASAVEVAKKAI